MGFIARVAKFLGLLALLAVIGASAIWVVSLNHFRNSVTLEEQTAFSITMGTPFRQVVNNLAEAGLIAESRVKSVYLHGRRLGYQDRIKAGDFMFEAGTHSPEQILDSLTIPPQRLQNSVTILEGWNIWQIAAALDKAGICSGSEFLSIATDKTKAEAIVGSPVKGLEGYLFPDTYLFHPNTSPEEVARSLVSKHQRVWNEVKSSLDGEYRALKDTQKFDETDLIIISSLVEKEAKSARDKRLVSRVIYNRLKAGWTLDIDPTCVYGPDTWHLIPTRSMCRNPSNTWSTYVNPGLPPGPIGNPSRDAMIATLQPESSAEALKYFFFVLKPDGSGEHKFSATRAEHNRAVREYVKSLNSNK